MSSRHVVLIACVSRKLDIETRAEDLYASDLFEKCLAFARSLKASPYILSAKHGLLQLDDRIEKYDETLKDKSVAERRAWSQNVMKSLAHVVSRGDRVTFLAGQKYREFLLEPLRAFGAAISIPLEGLSIGNQLKWLGNTIVHRNDFQATLRIFHFLDAVKQLGFYAARFSDFEPEPNFPKRGVYVFTDPNEFSRVVPDCPRIVRIGTHAVSKGSSSTLWQRLRTHRGTAAGGGNHRGSIFRLHVGKALARRDGLQFPTWGIGQSASREIIMGEVAMEEAVSRELGRFSMYSIPIRYASDPGSDRSFVERNLIALLSRQFSPFEVPRPGWLGLQAVPEEIQSSGLWNINYTGDFPDYRVIDYLFSGLDAGFFAEGGTPSPRAPEDWRMIAQQLSKTRQLSLFNNE